MELRNNASADGRPRGLLLLGGGALGSWQAGVLTAWDRAGVRFDRILGISIGALNGVAYAFGLVDELLSQWHTRESRTVLRLSPRDWLRGSVFSGRPLRNRLTPLSDERELARRARSSFYSVSCGADDRQPVVASFEAGGRWDGRLIDHLVAGSALPWIFPSVQMEVGGRSRTLVDGGYARCGAAALKPLEGCGELVVVGMVPPEEARGEARGPWDRINKLVKRALYSQARTAALAARGWTRAPEICNVYPRSPLRQFVLDFNVSRCREGFLSGLEDGAAFLSSPAPVPAPLEGDLVPSLDPVAAL